MPSVSYRKGSLPDVLMTANFQTDAEKELKILKDLQPNKPLMVAELWSGWFDHWGDKHEEISVDIYVESLKLILSKNASFNIYVFQGGTNFEFMNGANVGFPLPETPYSCTVTSYDYGALLTESGEYTKKYSATRTLLRSFEKEDLMLELKLNMNYEYLQIDQLLVESFLPLNKVLPLAAKFERSNPVVMEELDQRFGFSLYEKKFNKSGILEFSVTQGVRIVIFVDFKVIFVKESAHGFQSVHVNTCSDNDYSTLWILIENLGRINFTEESKVLNNERRGIIGPAKLNNISLYNWTVYSLNFDTRFLNDITSVEWEKIDASESILDIGLYAAFFNLEEVKDSFLFSTSWNKGIAIVNGFNIGRYWKVGPQQTLYIPKHFLKVGMNQIFVFEVHDKVTQFQLKNSHVLNVTK